ncbi:hypothetical protein SDRG_09847 [Saprolegnia diclina VS20]|uniref:WW domain-containing protein n=1 Tax=Saprolegnia diclina (strain VS20) TaxID=1156394 RepID=T0QCV4_SAPDV|nr:hypothetical protein SDRG_09847 [Saprolegnia diclina VS20]EQC32521.1 hypothetical protein SDRG_09847 [Saprolegnia diclina VS20]|eukprot:XP_008614022.1 hypothetical protein SDRG_09847 [Saprolegnia diclina VS20]
MGPLPKPRSAAPLPPPSPPQAAAKLPAKGNKTKKKAKHPLQKGRFTWGLRMRAKKQDVAARMIQRLFRSYAARCRHIENRYRVRMAMTRVKAHHVLFDRTHWQQVDLHALKRTELEDLALRLEIPGFTGKKGQLIQSIQHWIDLRMHVRDVALEAATRANDKRLQAQGGVYVLAATPESRPTILRPLSGRSISTVAANFESEAVYAIDTAKGMVWLCKTSGLAAQVGLCSTLRDQDVFTDPYAAQWLVTPVPMQTLRMGHIQSLCVGHTHAAALASTGEMYMWGNNPYGQLGLDHAVRARQRPFIVGVTETYTTVSIGVGTQHSLAACDNVKEQNGVVFAWGGNAHGQLGLGASAMVSTPQRIAALEDKNVRKVACGAMHSLVATDTGDMYAWGCSDGGRLGLISSDARVTEPRRIEGLSPPFHCAIAVACSAWQSAAILAESPALNAGTVFTWGTGVYGQLGLGSNQVAQSPQMVPLPPMKSPGDPRESVRMIACGLQHMAALTVQGHLYTWGSKDAFSPLPHLLSAKHRPRGRIASLACGASFTIFCTLPVDEVLYEAPTRHLLWQTKRLEVPKLDMSRLPTEMRLTSADKVVPRLQPEAERYENVQAAQDEAERIEAVDLDTWLHPRCRLCWFCTGFQITLTKLKLCRVCKHNREFHGRREGPMTQYEAVRKVQSKWRQRQGTRFLHSLFLERVQRVFSIRHNAFFYYNTCNRAKTWVRPTLLPSTMDCPIRDPDDAFVKPPLTEDDAASVIAGLYRGWKSRKKLASVLRARFEQCTDRQGRTFYRDRCTNATRWDLPLQRKRKREQPGTTVSHKAKRPSTQDDALVLLQRWTRGVLGRMAVAQLVRRLYRALLDPSTGNTYYYNTRTKQVTWTKPRWLRDAGQSKRRRRQTPFSEDEAASTLQRMYRGRLARRLLAQLLQERFQKVWDPTAQRYYFVDKETNNAVSSVPKAAQSIDTLVLPKMRRKRRKKRVLTPDTAALLVQNIYRARQARRAAAVRANRVIEQIWDPSSNAFFYHNKQTHAVSWTKPPFWVDKVATATPLENAKESSPEQATTPSEVPTTESTLASRPHRRRAYCITDANEAAVLLQTHFRRRNARDQCKAKLLQRFQRVYDPNTKRYFYYDKETSVSQWTAPRMLEQLQKTTTKHVSQETAAVRIQGVFRLRQARRDALALAQSNYEKVYDEAIHAYYYFNTKTGESQWTKPKCLRDADAVLHVLVNAATEPTEDVALSAQQA